jgi:hypothetical protein
MSMQPPTPVVLREEQAKMYKWRQPSLDDSETETRSMTTSVSSSSEALLTTSPSDVRDGRVFFPLETHCEEDDDTKSSSNSSRPSCSSSVATSSQNTCTNKAVGSVASSFATAPQHPEDDLSSMDSTSPSHSPKHKRRTVPLLNLNLVGAGTSSSVMPYSHVNRTALHPLRTSLSHDDQELLDVEDTDIIMRTPSRLPMPQQQQQQQQQQRPTSPTTRIDPDEHPSKKPELVPHHPPEQRRRSLDFLDVVDQKSKRPSAPQPLTTNVKWMVKPRDSEVAVPASARVYHPSFRGIEFLSKDQPPSSRPSSSGNSFATARSSSGYNNNNNMDHEGSKEANSSQTTSRSYHDDDVQEEDEDHNNNNKPAIHPKRSHDREEEDNKPIHPKRNSMAAETTEKTDDTEEHEPHNTSQYYRTTDDDSSGRLLVNGNGTDKSLKSIDTAQHEDSDISSLLSSYGTARQQDDESSGRLVADSSVIDDKSRKSYATAHSSPSRRSDNDLGDDKPMEEKRRKAACPTNDYDKASKHAVTQSSNDKDDDKSSERRRGSIWMDRSINLSVTAPGVDGASVSSFGTAREGGDNWSVNTFATAPRGSDETNELVPSLATLRGESNWTTTSMSSLATSREGSDWRSTSVNSYATAREEATLDSSSRRCKDDIDLPISSPRGENDPADSTKLLFRLLSRSKDDLGIGYSSHRQPTPSSRVFSEQTTSNSELLTDDSEENVHPRTNQIFRRPISVVGGATILSPMFSGDDSDTEPLECNGFQMDVRRSQPLVLKGNLHDFMEDCELLFVTGIDTREKNNSEGNSGQSVDIHVLPRDDEGISSVMSADLKAFMENAEQTLAEASRGVDPIGGDRLNESAAEYHDAVEATISQMEGTTDEEDEDALDEDSIRSLRDELALADCSFDHGGCGASVMSDDMTVPMANHVSLTSFSQSFNGRVMQSNAIQLPFPWCTPDVLTVPHRELKPPNDLFDTFIVDNNDESKSAGSSYSTSLLKVEQPDKHLNKPRGPDEGDPPLMSPDDIAILYRGGSPPRRRGKTRVLTSLLRSMFQGRDKRVCLDCCKYVKHCRCSLREAIAVYSIDLGPSDPTAQFLIVSVPGSAKSKRKRRKRKAKANDEQFASGADSFIMFDTAEASKQQAMETKATSNITEALQEALTSNEITRKDEEAMPSTPLPSSQQMDLELEPPIAIGTPQATRKEATWSDAAVSILETTSKAEDAVALTPLPPSQQMDLELEASIALDTTEASRKQGTWSDVAVSIMETTGKDDDAVTSTPLLGSEQRDPGEEPSDLHVTEESRNHATGSDVTLIVNETMHKDEDTLTSTPLQHSEQQDPDKETSFLRTTEASRNQASESVASANVIQTTHKDEDTLASSMLPSTEQKDPDKELSALQATEVSRNNPADESEATVNVIQARDKDEDALTSTLLPPSKKNDCNEEQSCLPLRQDGTDAPDSLPPPTPSQTGGSSLARNEDDSSEGARNPMPTESPEKLGDNNVLASGLANTSIPAVVFIKQAPSSIQDKNKLVPKAPKTPNRTKGSSEIDETMVDLDFDDSELKTLNAIKIDKSANIGRKGDRKQRHPSDARPPGDCVTDRIDWSPLHPLTRPRAAQHGKKKKRKRRKPWKGLKKALLRLLCLRKKTSQACF